jgi:hypothetical protein
MSAEHDNELMDRARATFDPYYRAALARHIRLIRGYPVYDKLPHDCMHSGARGADGRCENCGRPL